MLRGLLRFLLECVEHVDRFGELGYYEHAMFRRGVNPNLVDPGADRRHWFPVIGLLSLLEQVHLIPGFDPRLLGKLSHVLP